MYLIGIKKAVFTRTRNFALDKNSKTRSQNSKGKIPDAKAEFWIRTAVRLLFTLGSNQGLIKERWCEGLEHSSIALRKHSRY